MDDIARYKYYIRLRERNCRQVAELPDKPWLTVDEAAAGLGISPKNLTDWVRGGVIPRPRKWDKCARKRNRPIFRRTFVEAIRDALIIWRSTPGYRLRDFQKSAWKMSWGYR